MPSPPLGDLAGHELLAELGRGGMGVVFSARHRATGAERAVKVLSGAFEPDAVERFQREASVLARMSGPGVVTVHQAGVAGARPFIVMALLRGGTLRERLAARGRLPWAEAAALVRDLARALERCHAAGLVHRDLKPENVLFDQEGRAFLTDFGCVRDLHASTLTQTGALLGTPLYMAPEQLDGQRPDARADVYALGAVLHELVSGTPPHAARSALELLAKKSAQPPPSLTPHGAPPELDALVASALAPSPEHRPASAGDLARALDALLAGEKPALPPPRRKKGWLAPVGLGLLLAAALTSRHGGPAHDETAGGAPVATATGAGAPVTAPARDERPAGRERSALVEAIRWLEADLAVDRRGLEDLLASDHTGVTGPVVAALALHRLGRERVPAEKDASLPVVRGTFERAERAFLPLGAVGGRVPSELVELVRVFAAATRAGITRGRVSYDDALRRALLLAIREHPGFFVSELVQLVIDAEVRPARDDERLLADLDAVSASVGVEGPIPDELSDLRHRRAELAHRLWALARETGDPAPAKRDAAIDRIRDYLVAPAEQHANRLGWAHYALAGALEQRRELEVARHELDLALSAGGAAWADRGDMKLGLHLLRARLRLALGEAPGEVYPLLLEVAPLESDPARRKTIVDVALELQQLAEPPPPARRAVLAHELGGPPPP